MAELIVDDTHVHVLLTPLEKVGALHGDVTLPLEQVRLARSTDHPFAELRGIRAPGTGIPRVLALGTWRGRHGRDFVAISRGDAEAVVLELEDGAGWSRLVIGVPDGAPILERLRT